MREFSVLEIVPTYGEGPIFLHSCPRGVLSNFLIFVRETGDKRQLSIDLIGNSHTKSKAGHLFLCFRRFLGFYLLSIGG